jgi:hypothetical protein
VSWLYHLPVFSVNDTSLILFINLIVWSYADLGRMGEARLMKLYLDCAVQRGERRR